VIASLLLLPVADITLATPLAVIHIWHCAGRCQQAYTEQQTCRVSAITSPRFQRHAGRAQRDVMYSVSNTIGAGETTEMFVLRRSAYSYWYAETITAPSSTCSFAG